MGYEMTYGFELERESGASVQYHGPAVKLTSAGQIPSVEIYISFRRIQAHPLQQACESLTQFHPAIFVLLVFHSDNISVKDVPLQANISDLELSLSLALAARITLAI